MSDDVIRDEFRAALAAKDPRPFVNAPCPDCGLIGGFLVNENGTRWPERCIPCQHVIERIGRTR